MAITITGNDAGATRTSLGLGDASTKTVGVSNGNVIAADATGIPAINGSQVTALNASNLGSGTVADARFPATLPAASGVNLTALNATNLGSGTVATARLGSGTASSSTFLRGDGSWQAAGGGGSWELISNTTPTDDATSHTITGMTGFKAYKIIWTSIIDDAAGGDMTCRFGDASSIRSGASDYVHHTMRQEPGTGSSVYQTSTGASMIELSSEACAVGTGLYGEMFISRVDNTSEATRTARQPMVYGHVMRVTASTGSDPNNDVFFGGFIGTAFLADRIQFLNTVTPQYAPVGNFRLYGLKES